MSRLLMIPLLFVLFTSCSESADTGIEKPKEEKSEPVTAVTERACYRRLDGTKNQDTTSIEISNKANVITGKLDWKPFEKDRRSGKFSAILAGNVMKGVWVFMQEGIMDSIPVEFKLSGDTLFRRPSKVDKKNGRELIDSTADYSIPFIAVSCRQDK